MKARATAGTARSDGCGLAGSASIHVTARVATWQMWGPGAAKHMDRISGLFVLGRGVGSILDMRVVAEGAHGRSRRDSQGHYDRESCVAVSVRSAGIRQSG